MEFLSPSEEEMKHSKNDVSDYNFENTIEEIQLIIDKSKKYKKFSIDNYNKFKKFEPIELEIHIRKERNKIFTKELFVDPAWDMMLDLYRAYKNEEKISVSSLCLASNSPPTTALRWIQKLLKNGLIERSADPNDRRKVYITLSAKSLQSMWILEQGISKDMA